MIVVYGIHINLSPETASSQSHSSTINIVVVLALLSDQKKYTTVYY